MIPTIKQLMHEQAKLVKYQDGVLWYQIVWLDDKRHPRIFDFPVKVDVPGLYEIIEEAVDDLDYVELDARIEEVQGMLKTALEDHKKESAGQGEFGRMEKAITLMRWIRKHIEYLTNLEELNA